MLNKDLDKLYEQYVSDNLIDDFYDGQDTALRKVREWLKQIQKEIEK